jgi:molybdopterin-guanine dinucleotide biosynthesis protein A
MNISTAILAGGNSVRFGTDKTLIELSGKSIIQYSIDEFKDITNLYIIAKDDRKFKHLDVPIIIDKYKHQSPLVGIITALENINDEIVFILSADMPLIKKSILSILLDNIEESDDIVLPYIEGKIYALTGIYRKHVKSTLEYFYNRKIYKIIDAFRALHVKMIDEKYFIESNIELYSFVNINSWDQYKNAERTIQENNKTI